MAEDKFTQIKIKDWKDFNLMIDRLHKTIPPMLGYLFRGQSIESWHLIPSFHRIFNASYLTETKELLRLEKLILHEFRQHVHLHLSTSIIKDIEYDNINCWMLMQHYYAPTRLLDWTASPHVAAYHACRGNFDEDGAVWLLNAWGLHEQMKKTYEIERVPQSNHIYNDFYNSNETSEVFFVDARCKTDRMIAQQGMFSVCRNIGGDQHDIISEACGTTREKGKLDFWKLIIPHEMKSEFLKKQYAMNITAGSLFPGLDGVGQLMSDLLHLNAHAKKGESLESNDLTIGDILKLGNKQDNK